MSNVFDFRPGRSIKNVNPQVAGEELERIRRERGSLIAAYVVEEAQREDSPLHNGFEWDDSVAGHQYRLGQARSLITSIKVLNSPVARNVPAFVSVKTPGHGRNYVPTVEALNDDEIRVRVMDDVRKCLEQLERKYAHFQAAADVIAGLKRNVG